MAADIVRNTDTMEIYFHLWRSVPYIGRVWEKLAAHAGTP